MLHEFRSRPTSTLTMMLGWDLKVLNLPIFKFTHFLISYCILQGRLLYKLYFMSIEYEPMWDTVSGRTLSWSEVSLVELELKLEMDSLEFPFSLSRDSLNSQLVTCKKEVRSWLRGE